MLITTDRKAVDYMPYPEIYNLIRVRLPGEELKAIKDILIHQRVRYAS